MFLKVPIHVGADERRGKELVTLDDARPWVGMFGLQREVFKGARRLDEISVEPGASSAKPTDLSVDLPNFLPFYRYTEFCSNST